MATNKVFPIGSVVKCRNVKFPVVIIGRGQMTRKQNGETGYLDYSAVIYTTGFTNSDQLILFNHEDIEELLYEGYRDKNEDEFAESYLRLIKKTGTKKFTIEELENQD